MKIYQYLALVGALGSAEALHI
jgi:hypothetical protein